MNGEPHRGASDVDVDRALDALRGTWGGAYAVGYDSTTGISGGRWRAWRLGGGGMVTGETPDELATAIRADWGARSAR
ncbi:MAG TPA: hypothetical protein VIY52_36305 [Streptosporangiaceae bacterium]